MDRSDIALEDWVVEILSTALEDLCTILEDQATENSVVKDSYIVSNNSNNIPSRRSRHKYSHI